MVKLNEKQMFISKFNKDPKQNLRQEALSDKKFIYIYKNTINNQLRHYTQNNKFKNT